MFYSILFYIYFALTTPVYYLIGFLLQCLTFWFDRDRKILHYYSYFWGLQHYWVQPWWRIRVTGRENAVPGKKYVIMSNHQSMLDICLLYKVPKLFKWISKKEVGKIPFVGWALYLHRDILITRGDRAGLVKMLKESDDYLQRGVSIIMFPEGTRTRDGRVHEFKEGGFMLAKKSNVAILPVAIDGNFDALQKNSWKLRRKQLFQVHILPEISETEVAETPTKELVKNVQRIITNEHKLMAPAKYAEVQPPFGVIFDMDGVLVNNHEYHREAFVALLKKHNVPDAEKRFTTSIYGKRNTDILREMFPEEKNQDVLLQFSDEKEALYRQIYRDHATPTPGLIELLEALKQAGIPMAIGSSAMLVNVDFILDVLHIRPYFTTIIHEQLVTNGKPDPEVFLKAAAGIGVPPSHCVVFEDAMAGVKAGRAAGAKVIGITSAHTPEELAPYVDYSLPDFTSVTVESLQGLISK